MHYHILWGLITAPEPFIMDFHNLDEAVDKFISLIKDVEGDSVKDGPPPWHEKKIDNNTTAIQVQSEKYKYMLVYCSNVCDRADSKSKSLLAN